MVHVGLCQHEVQVCAYGVGKCEGCQAADVRFGAVQGLFMCGSGDDGVVVLAGVGADVGIEDVLGSACDHPRGVEVAT